MTYLQEKWQATNITTIDFEKNTATIVNDNVNNTYYNNDDISNHLGKSARTMKKLFYDYFQERDFEVVIALYFSKSAMYTQNFFDGLLSYLLAQNFIKRKVFLSVNCSEEAQNIFNGEDISEKIIEFTFSKDTIGNIDDILGRIANRWFDSSNDQENCSLTHVEFYFTNENMILQAHDDEISYLKFNNSDDLDQFINRNKYQFVQTDK